MATETIKIESKINNDQSSTAIILGSLFVFCSLVGNIAATKVTYFGGMVMDAGFIYSLTFILRDLIHKNIGKSAAITTIWLSGLLNIIAVVYFQIVIWLPGEESWLSAGGQTAWQFIFGLQMRIFFASVLVQILAELVDTYIYQKWVTGIGSKMPQWTRVFVSNSVSIPVDSILFPLIAFGGVVSGVAIWQMFYTNMLVKGLTTLGFFWMIYLVPAKIGEIAISKFKKK